MNIAVVCYHNIGGSGIVAYELGAAFAAEGHSIHFLGLEPPFRMQDIQQNIIFHSVQVKDYPVFTYPPYTLSLASRLSEIVDQYDIDIIHCHYAVPHAVAGILAKQASHKEVKVVSTLHGTDITLVGSHPSFFNITKFAIQHSDVVTTVSDFLKQKTGEVFDIDTENITRIYNFIDPAHFRPDLSCPFLESRKTDEKIIVHASNLRDVKNPLDLIRVFKKTCEDVPHECVLWIVGEGPKRCEMEKRAQEYGLTDRIEFFGVVSDPAIFFANADLFLLTSREESFGLAALESMACGTPAISYATGGVSEVIEHGKSGCLVENGDTDTMAEYCTALLSDPDELSRMKHNARSAAIEKFPKKKIVEQYLELF